MFSNHTLKKVAHLLRNFAKSDRRYRIKLHSWDDFDRIPISGRSDLKTFAENNVIRDAFNIAATSGSTSSRMLIAHSQDAYRAHEKRLIKLYSQAGIKKGTLCLNLCSYELNSGGRLMERAFKAIGAGVIPLGPISTPDKILEAVQLIKHFKPTIANAYTNQLFDLFTTLGRKHSIRRCLATGELLWPHYRSRIERMGRVSVLDHYGIMEFSGLAVAIKSTDEYMKLFSEGLLLEVQDDCGKVSRTGVGSLLVTDLDNQCMPFIRYQVGDRVKLIRHKGSLWIKILGRTTESISVNGVVAIKQELIRIVNDFIGHPNFFFVLDKHRLHYGDKLIVNVLGSSLKDMQALPSIIVKASGLDNCIIVRKHTGKIPRTLNGKIKYFISTNKIQKDI